MLQFLNPAPSFLSKTEITKYFLYTLLQHLIKKLKRKEEVCWVITPAVVVTIGTYVDGSQETVGMVC